jgi:hypothetical protein
MKLFLLSRIHSTCDAACSALHWVEKRVQDVRMWAWTRATKENLRKCNVRAVKNSVYS